MSLAHKYGQRIKSSYTIIFQGLVHPSVFGVLDEETVRGLIAQWIGLYHESGVQNAS